MEGGRDEAKKPDERVEWRRERGEGCLNPKIFNGSVETEMVVVTPWIDGGYVSNLMGD